MKRRIRVDALSWCRSETCPRDDLHFMTKECRKGSQAFDVVAVPERSKESYRALEDAVYRTIGDYVPKGFYEIYAAVLDDYGTVGVRNVNRALETLRAERRVALIPPLGASARAVGHTVGYVRYSSPRLWAPGGLRELREQTLDIIDGIDRTKGAGR